MVTINKVYTKTGDDGETSLGNFERVAKYDLRVEAYGTVDELNSHLGMARLVSTGDMAAKLSSIQNDLFDLGADLCRPNMEKDGEAKYEVLRLVRSQVDRLEHEIEGSGDYVYYGSGDYSEYPESFEYPAVEYPNFPKCCSEEQVR